MSRVRPNWAALTQVYHATDHLLFYDRRPLLRKRGKRALVAHGYFEGTLESARWADFLWDVAYFLRGTGVV